MSASPPPPYRLSPPRQDLVADEREFEAFARTQDPVDIEAARWAARRRDGLDAQGLAELQSWLDADPRHAARFNEMEGLFAAIAQVTKDDVASLVASLPVRAPSQAASLPTVPIQADASQTRPIGLPTSIVQSPLRRPSVVVHRGRPPAPARLASLAAAAAVAIVVSGVGWAGWKYWQRLPVFEQTYATGRGQVLSITLPDAKVNGSGLHLDTSTRAIVRLYRDRREVDLTEGQAQFLVAADAQRPFHVRAGPVHITVVGTRFSVRHTDTGLDAGQTVISVEEGRVRVQRIENSEAGGARSSAAAFAPSLDLIDGQRTVADAQGQFGPVAILPPSVMSAWRNGRLSFDQTPLGEAIAEFERYGRTGLVVTDPAIAALPVGGSYSLSQAWRFAQTLPQMLPVRLVRRGELTEIVAR